MDVNYHMRHELKGNDRDEPEYMWERLVAAIGDISLFKQQYHMVKETSVLHFFNV
ncbi:hypothetical protein GCM10020331_043950 [Ectobacillus funiculus]